MSQNSLLTDFIVVDGNIDFTGNYVLTNFNPRSVSCKNFTA